MRYLFTSESVSEGHPDKVADQISDAILDEYLKYDKESKVACEVLVTKDQIIVAGEVRARLRIPDEQLEKVIRNVVKEIGYDRPELDFDYASCKVQNLLHKQSDDIFQGVVKKDRKTLGAGDQGMMFGYACTEMDNYMPMAVEIAHMLVQELASIRKEGKIMPYLRPDSKSQVTIEYEDDKPIRIDTIVVSTQHDEFVMPSSNAAEEKERAQEEMRKVIEDDMIKYLFPRVKSALRQKYQHLMDAQDIKLLINPSGKFVIGGPASDTGLTGRKIIVDTYGGASPHGGGAFSGKDATKVDRSAAYACRHIAKNLVAAGIASRVLVQVAYAIGKPQPVSIFVDTFGGCKVKDENGNTLSDSVLAEKVMKIFDLSPHGIIDRLKLFNPIYAPTASYGHFGRDIEPAEVCLQYADDDTYVREIDGKPVNHKVIEYFTWEKTDYVDKIKAGLNL